VFRQNIEVSSSSCSYQGAGVILDKYFRDADRGSNSGRSLQFALVPGYVSRAPRPKQIGDRESQCSMLEAAQGVSRQSK